MSWKQLLHIYQHLKTDINKPLKALLVDGWYDKYLGVVLLARVFEGSLEINKKIKNAGNKCQISNR